MLIAGRAQALLRDGRDRLGCVLHWGHR
jgi:hypothetical protein